MNIYFYISIAFFLAVLIYGFSLVIAFGRKKKLQRGRKTYFLKLLQEVDSQKEPKQRIIDYDKLYHKILLDLGYEGDFGAILKLVPNEVKNINKVWELHKFRNKLVHEFNIYGNELLEKTSKEYKREILKLLK